MSDPGNSSKMAENKPETSTDSVENDPNTSTKACRMSLLHNVMDKTVKQFIKKLRLVTPLTDIPYSVLQQLQSQVVNQLESNIKSEFEQIYTEENIESLLNGLDRLIEQTPPSANPQAWRPSGSVKRDICPTAAKLKQEKLKSLQNTLSDLEAQNKLLSDKVEKREKRLIQTKDKIVGTVQDIEQITFLDGTRKDELLSTTGKG